MDVNSTLRQKDRRGTGWTHAGAGNSCCSVPVQCASLKREYISFSNHRSSCPWKGQAYYYSLFVNGDMNENAVWYYPEPSEAAAEIKGRVAFWKGVQVTA